MLFTNWFSLHFFDLLDLRLAAANLEFLPNPISH
jgi:hypothetical protein